MPASNHATTHELYGVIPTDTRKPFDVREVIARIVDGSEFDEFKAALRHHAGLRFARIYGYPVGIVANNGVLFSESGLGRALHRTVLPARIPLVFPQNITNTASWSAEYENGGIARNGARWSRRSPAPRCPSSR